MSGVMGASLRSSAGSPACTAIVSVCSTGSAYLKPLVATHLEPITQTERLPVEEADATSTAIAFAAALAYDADASIVFEHRHLDIPELVHAMFADGHLDVGLTEPFFFQRRLADLAILDHDGGWRLDQCVEPHPAAAQKRNGAVEDQQDRDDDHAARDRVVRAGDGGLQRGRHQQHEDLVEGP